MELFLTSSPFMEDADRAILDPANGLTSRLRTALPENVNCLVICSDPDSFDMTDGFAGDLSTAFSEANIPVGDVAVLDGRNIGEAADAVAWSGLIVLMGGHTPTQNRFFRDAGLAPLLRDYPGVILGISAGSMNCAAMVYAHPELPGEGIDPDYERFLPGLGLTFVNLIPHYRKIQHAELDGQQVLWDIAMADSFDHVFYVLPDGSYFHIRQGRTELLGEAYRMENGHFAQIAENGGILTL